MAKLPKMSNSERGKYYRQKYKEYEDGLEESVMKLNKQIQDLELLLRLHKQLAIQNPMRKNSSGGMVGQVFRYFMEAQWREVMSTSFTTEVKPSGRAAVHGEFSAQRIPLPSLQPSVKTEPGSGAFTSTQWDQFFMHHEYLFFDLGSSQISGHGGGSPVISLEGTLHAVFTVKTIVNVFPHIALNQELVDRLVNQKVSYLCTFAFYFNSNGELQQHNVEADVVQGLHSVLDNLADVNLVLAHSSSDTPLQIRVLDSWIPLTRAESDATGSPMNLDFILT